MARPLTQIGNEVREMNDAEFAQYEVDQVRIAETTAAISAAAQKRQIVLEALAAAAGLDVEEVKEALNV